VLQDAGGWPARDTALRFAEYAAAVHERLGDRVARWTTLNEPWCSSLLGHASGRHAPGVRDGAAAMRAAHHLLLGHGLAVVAMRSQGKADNRYGITVNLAPVTPASESEADRDAARRIDGLLNRLFLDPVLLGRYPADVLADVAHVSDAAHIQAGDERTIAAPLDFLGINYYFRNVVKAGEARAPEASRVRAGEGRAGEAPPAEPSPWVGSEAVEFVGRGLPRTEMGWEIDASGLYDVLMRLARDYPAVPLYVTENGAAFPDAPAADGSVADPERVAYLASHLRAAHGAIADGADLRGYFVWTLMDNFEWSFGYDKRFGLVHVDYETLRRTPKDSARWFAAVTRRGGLADG
jgi:beta-glucosidase